MKKHRLAASGFRMVGIIFSVLLMAGLETGWAAANAWLTTTGLWETAGNWSDGVPDGTDAVSITNAGASATLGNGAADFDLGMNVTSITVGVNGGLSAVTVGFTNTAKTLYIGGATTGEITIGEKTAGKYGQLTVNNGNIDTYKLVVGKGANASGQLVIAGGKINVRSGDYPLAGFSVADSVEQVTGSTGTVIMTGGELAVTGTALYAYIGAWGKGTMIISNGLFTSKTLYVGGSGQGELKIFGGTNLVLNQMLIPGGSAGRGAVLVDGGTLDTTNVSYTYINNGVLTVSNGFAKLQAPVVGYNNGTYGVLNIAGGATTVTYANQRGKIGDLAGSTGVVNVTGGFLDWADVLYIGRDGRGTINVSSGLCRAAYTLIGSGASWGDLNITGGTYRNNPNWFEVRRGAIQVSGGAFTNTGATMIIGSAAGQTGTVTVVSGTFSVTNCTTTVGNPGVGTLEVQGKNSTITLKALTADTANSTLKFTLGATGVSPIEVTNALTVTSSSKLVVDMTSYNKVNGDADLITYGTMSGTFDATNITITGGSAVWTIRQTSGKVTLKAPSPGTIFTIF